MRQNSILISCYFPTIAKGLCAKGWQVCNPRHSSYLKLLTWEDASRLDGCYAYNAANTLNQCARYVLNNATNTLNQCARYVLNNATSTLNQTRRGHQLQPIIWQILPKNCMDMGRIGPRWECVLAFRN